MASSTAPPLPERARARWSELGGKLGLGLVLAGFVLIFLAWNGAASLDFTQGQIPYLISGGVSGLALVVVGASLLVVDSHRRDRALLQREVRELSLALERMAATAPSGDLAGAQTDADAVVAGRASFHRPDCHLAAGRDGAARRDRAEAEAAGLAPCRVCRPDEARPVADRQAPR